MDLSKVRDKLKSLEESNSSGGGFKKDLIWRPELGSQVIRFVPNMHNPDYPFLELYFYYELEKFPVISPISWGESDPIVELAEELKNRGNKEDFKMGCQLEPKLRTYAPVLVRGEEELGVRYYGFGKTVFTELLELIDDPDYGDITDPKKGTDITIKYSKDPGESYPKTSLLPKRSVSPMTTDRAVLEMVKNMPDAKTIWPIPTYQEMEEKLERYKNGSKVSEKENGGSDNKAAKTPPRTGSGDPFDGLDDDMDTPLDGSEPNTEKDEEVKGIQPTKDVDSMMDDIFGE